MAWSRDWRINGNRRMAAAFSFVTFILVLAVITAVPAAQHRSWLAAAVDGDVRRFIPFSTAWRQVEVGDRLSPGTQVRTGMNGHLTMIRGRDTLVIYPESAFVVSGDPDYPPDSIFQSLGKLLFEVDHRETRSFSVETPLLAATVKGTRFVVVVTPSRSTVTVEAGSVEVTVRTTGETALLQPGMTATVSASDNDLRVTAVDMPADPDAVDSAVDAAADTVSGAAGTATDTVGRAAGAATDAVGGAAGAATDAARDALDGAGGLLK